MFNLLQNTLFYFLAKYFFIVNYLKQKLFVESNTNISIDENKILDALLSLKLKEYIEPIKDNIDHLFYEANKHKMILTTVLDDWRDEKQNCFLSGLFLEMDVHLIFKVGGNVEAKLIKNANRYLQFEISFENGKKAQFFKRVFLKKPPKGYHIRDFLTREKFNLYKNVRQEIVDSRFYQRKYSLITENGEIFLRQSKYLKRHIKSITDCTSLIREAIDEANEERRRKNEKKKTVKNDLENSWGDSWGKDDDANWGWGEI